ncbi:FAD-dependent oxidoreductase [Dietzia massiliensis]|uniref:FAD-dependent oxidoreductase n=1 Tax=Dietzia massiliensis TaxID=2697499 RepID=UPI001BCC53B7|nr:FAD-dependent oxidoreductase [Dietzia massiliensis]MBS7549095.1 FAD-dependent oxidoreductase [Dietzia massiliensis]
MPHVITQACCADASCVHACPVNCIHPTPDEPDFATAEMLYIDPVSCVDCGACVGACPVGAIVPHTELAPEQHDFLQINAELTGDDRPSRPQARVPTLVRLGPTRTTVRVAVVGAGPAALYAADELLRQPGVEVTVFERLPVPHGLARHGVAPDHTSTRAVADLFRAIEDQPGFGYRLGVHVGEDVTAAELAAHHHAVVYATGAGTDRPLDIPGTDLPGSTSATEVVAWYNDHPDHADAHVPLDHERAVIVGNGNVALDVARILATDPERLADTSIARHALEALRDSRVREVVVLGRRGPEHAAFTLPELVGLAARDDIDLRVDAPDGIDPDAATPRQGRLKAEYLARIAARPAGGEAPADGLDSPDGPDDTSGPGDTERRRIVLRFQTAPVEVVGTDRAEGLRVVRTDLVGGETGRVRAVPRPGSEETIPAGLVLGSVGYRGVEVPGVPFDPDTATIPSREGRVLDAVDGSVVPGLYVVGWIKRGPRGFLGSNKTCARETVNSLLADANAGLLPTPRSAAAFEELLRDRGRGPVGAAGWGRPFATPARTRTR